MAGEARRRRLRALCKRAGTTTSDTTLIERAFVHESAAKERGLRSNQRLEFLGDSVLGVVAARWLYEQFPDEPEGALAKRKAALCSDRAIAQTAARLGFADLIDVGAGERAHGGNERPSVLADAFEAFLAALYLTEPFGAVRAFVEREHFASVDLERAALGDPKTQLQEFTQGTHGGTPRYEESAAGPAHQRTFTSSVFIEGRLLATGTGPSKKAAQQAAAATALETLRAGAEPNGDHEAQAN